MTVTKSSGKRIWTTAAPFVPGSGSPDAWCASNAPAGVSGAKALVARVGSTAASLLSTTAVYVRVDGQRVGTGADLIAAADGAVDYYSSLDTGIRQDNLGSYKQFGYHQVWTGAKSLGTQGTTASTCGDWADPTQTAGKYGLSTASNGDFFGWSTRQSRDQPCNTTGDRQGVLYCFEP